MNKKALIFLPLVAMSLASCVDTDGLLEPTAYLSGAFIEREYAVYEGSTKEAKQNIAREVTLEQLPYEVDKTKKGYFAGTGEGLSLTYGAGQAQSYHPDYFQTKDGKTLYWGAAGDVYSDILPGQPGVWVDNSSLYDVVYSQNKRLDRFYPDFARGYLSKLYNGQIKCDGWSYFAMILFQETGFGTMFPYELASAEYFAFSALMGTDDETNPRQVIADIGVTFFKYADVGSKLVSYRVNLEDVHLSCNNSSSRTSLIGFTFADVGIDPKGIVGISYDWKLVEDFSYNEVSGDFSKPGYHDGICLYEILFPDSTWI